MFTRVGYIEGTKDGSFDAEEEAIEAGANDVEKHDAGYAFYTSPEELMHVRENLSQRGWKLTTTELSYKANNKTEITPEQKAEVEKFIDDLDDLDDTHRIHATI